MKSRSLLPSTTEALKIIERRQELLKLRERLREQGKTNAEIEKELGVSKETLHRWAKLQQELGIAGLLQHLERCGRPSFFQKLGVTDPILERVRKYAVQCGNANDAWRRYAREDKCPPKLAAFILNRKEMPVSFREAVKLTVLPAKIIQSGTAMSIHVVK